MGGGIEVELRKSRIAFVLAFISFVIALIFIPGASKGEPLPFDVLNQTWIDRIFGESAATFFGVITHLGSATGIGAVAIIFLIWLWWKKRNYSGMAMVVFAIALGNEANKLLKEVVGRPRPISENAEAWHDLSFPSGHAMVGFILYMLIAYFLMKEVKQTSTKWIIGIVAGIIVLLVGMSRNVLHVHYPSDVFGGFALGYLWTFLFIALYEVFGSRLNKKKA